MPSPLVSPRHLALTRDRSHWQTGPTSQSPRRPRRVRPRRGHLRPPSSSSPRPLATAATSLHGTARRAVSSSLLCGINSGVVHLTGVRRAPPLPSPQAPIKGSPRALPCPAPASATPLPPRPRSVAKVPPSSSPPVSPSPSSPFPSGGSARNWLGSSVAPLCCELGTPLPYPNPCTNLTVSDSRRGAPPPPRGQPPPGLLWPN
jgi:hypothetical protein